MVIRRGNEAIEQVTSAACLHSYIHVLVGQKCYVESSSSHFFFLVSVCACADGGSNCLYDNFSAEERERLVECYSGYNHVLDPQVSLHHDIVFSV